jgi:glycine/D-amino acid oxidase-like deaminating enzyme
MTPAVSTGLDIVLDRCQVAVVGGGIVGVSTAYFLSEKGYDVVLLEREHLAFGASGRNAGIQWIHTRTKGLALDLARLGVRIMEQLESELGRSFELDRSGGMFYFMTDAQRRVFQELAQARAADGVRIEVLDEGQPNDPQTAAPRSPTPQTTTCGHRRRRPRVPAPRPRAR